MVFFPVGDKNCAAHDTAMRQDAKGIDLDRLLHLIFIPFHSRFCTRQKACIYFSAGEKLAQ